MIETTQRILGFIPLDSLLEMTPNEWNLRIKGARHQRIDALEDAQIEAVIFARLNNGKPIKEIAKALRRERALIDSTEDSYEYEQKKAKQDRAKIRAKQRADLAVWLANRNQKG